MAYVKTGAPRGHPRAGSHSASGFRRKQRSRPFETYFKYLKRSAERPKQKKVPHIKRNPIPWTITYEEFVVFVEQKECHYCNEPVLWPSAYEMCGRTNLDRKDNDVCYTADNCIPCCYSCNVTKSSTLTYEEMIAVGNIRKNKPRIIVVNQPRGYGAPKQVQESATEPDQEPEQEKQPSLFSS